MRIYATTYHLGNGENKRQKEHQTGLNLLRYGLKEAYHLSFSQENLAEELGKGEHGKPYLKRFPQICFNISHSNGIAVCAISQSGVGIDVERIGAFRATVARRVLTEKEIEFLETLAEHERGEMFYRFWTLKESYLKLDGSGLARDPREIEFQMEKQADKWLAFCEDPRVWCCQKKLTEDCMMAVCWKPMAEPEEPENSEVIWLTGDALENL